MVSAFGEVQVIGDGWEVGWEVSEQQGRDPMLKKRGLVEALESANSQGQNTKVHKQIEKYFHSIATHENKFKQQLKKANLFKTIQLVKY